MATSAPTYDIRAKDDIYGSEDELSAALETGLGYKGKTIAFPGNLDEIDHWASFRVHEHTLLPTSDYPKDESLMTIFLPMPNNLATQYSQSYNSEGIGAAALAGANLIKSGVSAADFFDKDKSRAMIGKAASEVAKQAAYYTAGAAQEGIAALIGNQLGGLPAAVVGLAAGQMVKGVQGQLGASRNPYMTMLYDSPQLRKHDFTWKFIPQSVEESDTLQYIIQAFKFYSSPSMKNGWFEHFLDFPQQFDIDFHYQEYLFNIGPSVCTEFQVTYHAEGQPLYFNVPDFDMKAPVSVQLQASFTEVNIVTKESIEKEYR
jgi:hypothetical protein